MVGAYPRVRAAAMRPTTAALPIGRKKFSMSSTSNTPGQNAVAETSHCPPGAKRRTLPASERAQPAQRITGSIHAQLVYQQSPLAVRRKDSHVEGAYRGDLRQHHLGRRHVAHRGLGDMHSLAGAVRQMQDQIEIAAVILGIVPVYPDAIS